MHRQSQGEAGQRTKEWTGSMNAIVISATLTQRTVFPKPMMHGTGTAIIYFQDEKNPHPVRKKTAFTLCLGDRQAYEGQITAPRMSATCRPVHTKGFLLLLSCKLCLKQAKAETMPQQQYHLFEFGSWFWSTWLRKLPGNKDIPEILGGRTLFSVI